MPLMREWVEIAVDEDLLVPVVRELLDMAVDPNQVEVIHGADGRVILAEAHLAEHWFQERLKRDGAKDVPEEDFVTSVQTEVVASAEIIAPTPVPAVAKTAEVQPSTFARAAVPTPVRRVPAVKPSASPDGEES